MSDNYRLNHRGLRTYDTLLKQYIEENLPKEMNGATKYHDGNSGLTPTPITGDQNKFLKGDGTWSEIPSFINLYNVNEEPITVGQSEIEISFIECNLTKKVDLEGHFTVSLFSSENCDIYIRIKDDNVEELFTPQVYYITKGYCSIEIPHAYLGKSIGLHNFTVTAQCSNGEIIIPTRSLLYTIFGAIDDSYSNYGIDIVDIAIKRTDINSSPSEIWSVGFENFDNISELILRKNDYNNPNGNIWTNIHNFGNVKGGSLEFYGSWVLNLNKEILITEKNPFVFIIDNNDDLICFSNGDYDNGVKLSSNVEKVSACVGFKSNVDSTLEQGLVVVYIKNGNVYYRQWRYYDNMSNAWYAPEEIYTEGDAVDVQVHRLPDYRMGIFIKYSTGAKWLITDRTFVGNSAKDEKVNTELTCDSYVVMIEDYMIEQSIGTAIINEYPEQYYHNGFTMTFVGDLILTRGKTIEDLKNTMSASRNGTSIPIEDILIDGNKLIVHTSNDVKGGDTFTISWNLYELKTTIYNNCIIDTYQNYTWNLPTVSIKENVEDNYQANIGIESNIEIGQIIDLPIYKNDDYLVQIGVEADIIVGQIIDKQEINNDTIDDILIDIESDIECIQIEDIPV